MKSNLELYKSLYLIRYCEQRIIDLYHENEMRTPMHMSFGQEYIPVGVCSGLDMKCDITSSYRSHANFLAKTADYKSFFYEMYGKEDTVGKGKCGSMHLGDPKKGHILSSGIVASQIPAATGLAFANKYKKIQNFAICFFGDGAIDSGCFWESLNLACLFKLPVFFICEDNEWAVHTPKSDRRGYKDLKKIVGNFDLYFYEEESNDAEILQKKVNEAKNKYKRNPKPIFFNIRCYRYLAHIGIETDWNYNYRPKKVYNKWKKKDCLKIQKDKLFVKYDKNLIKNTEQNIEKKVDAVILKAKKSKSLNSREMFKGLFYEND